MHGLLHPSDGLLDSPEYRLVRLLARQDLGDDEWAEAGALMEVVSWGGTMRLAAYHRLMPLMWVHLSSQAGLAVPDDVLALLRARSLQSTVKVLFLTAEMARIGRRLDEDGVSFLVLKGPSLAEAYGSMGHRPFVDNDLLVRRSDFSRVERALLDLGFNQVKRSERQLRGYLFVHGEYTFGRGVGGQVSTVDVHTDVVPWGYSYDGAFEGLYARSREMDIGELSARVLSWADLFIVLSVNAIKDQWNRLRLASDLSALAPLIDDWNHLEALSRTCKSVKAYRAGILVSADELDAPYPEAVVQRARSDERARVMGTEIRQHLRTFHEERVMAGTDRAKLVLRAQDGVFGQARYLTYVMLRRATERLVTPYTST